jgi:hypothetical protein
MMIIAMRKISVVFMRRWKIGAQCRTHDGRQFNGRRLGGAV